MTILFQDLYLLYFLPFGLYLKLQMQSTYDQFLKTFKEDLHRVAEFEGEAEQTLNVIVGALESAKLKHHLDELDTLKQGSSGVRNIATVPVDTSRKATGGSRSKKATEEITESVDDTKPSKARRVTGYNVFVAEQVREKKNTMSEAAAVWKTMDESARAPYIERAANQNVA